MRRLSEKATEIVDRLYKLDKASGWLGRPRYCSDIIAALIELSSLKEPASVACVSRFLFSKDQTVRSTAQDAVAKILLGIAPLDVLQLSDAFGWEYGGYVDHAWNNLKPSQVGSLASVESDHASAAILGLLSFHRSGYVREESVKHLSQIADGTELPFLLIRQNDWVESVSQLAILAVKDRLAAEYIEHFTRNIELVAHLPEFGRNDLSEIAKEAIGQLLLPENDELLRAALYTRERTANRRLLKYGFELTGTHSSRLARHGLASDDAVIRLWSARRLLSELPDESLIQQLTDDSFAPIRSEAYQTKVHQSPESADVVWASAAFDRSSGIRDLARFHLRKYSHIDVHQLYLDKLDASPGSLPALAGLAECALADDETLLRQYSRHRYPSRRRIAISGLVRILGDTMADELVDWLGDVSPTVAKQAERSLKDIPNAIDGHRLFAVLKHSSTDAGRLAVLRLFYEMGKWKCLPWLIRSTGLENAFVDEHAEVLAYWWLESNTVFTKPKKCEENAIEDAYSDVRQVISASFVEKLREFLPFEIA